MSLPSCSLSYSLAIMSKKDVAFTGALVTLAGLAFIHFNELMHGSNKLIHEIQGKLSSVEVKLDFVEKELSSIRYTIDSVDSQGKSLLYKAIANGDAEAASALIAAGADVNVRDNQGISPLLIALYTEQEDIVDELIAAGAAGAAGAGNTRDNQNSFLGIDIAYADL